MTDGTERVKAQMTTTGYIPFLSTNLIPTYSFSNHMILAGPRKHTITMFIYTENIGINESPFVPTDTAQFIPKCLILVLPLTDNTTCNYNNLTLTLI